MSISWPRSIVSLILIGFTVVLIPLLGAVVTAIVQVDRLAQESRSAVLGAGQAIEQSRALVEQITEMRRALGQYAVRGDRDFFEIYVQRRAIYRGALEDLTGLEIEGLGRGELQAIGDEEARLFADLGGENGEARAGRVSTDATQALDELGNRTRAVLATSNELVSAKANEVIDRAESLQRTLLALTAVAAPATLLLIGLCTMLITRPMRALGDAIRRLGARSQEQPIAVHGPRDIEALGEELDLLRRRILSLEDQKGNFLRHISHELKTPLATLREGSELLTESLGEHEREEAEIARLMRENSLTLQKLIEDLLEFARTQEPVSDLELEDGVDLKGLIRSTVAAQSVACESKDIVVVEMLGDARVRGDPNKLRIIVDNLLTNAVKYTPRYGRITVSMETRDRLAIIDVIDTGPGIDPADTERIFEPFKQGQAKSQSSVKGTGLGLAIARELVEAHDGNIEVVDSENGAHFRVTLPMDGPARGRTS